MTSEFPNYRNGFEDSEHLKLAKTLYVQTLGSHATLLGLKSERLQRLDAVLSRSQPMPHMHEARDNQSLRVGVLTPLDVAQLKRNPSFQGESNTRRILSFEDAADATAGMTVGDILEDPSALPDESMWVDYSEYVLRGDERKGVRRAGTYLQRETPDRTAESTGVLFMIEASDESDLTICSRVVPSQLARNSLRARTMRGQPAPLRVVK